MESMNSRNLYTFIVYVHISISSSILLLKKRFSKTPFLRLQLCYNVNIIRLLSNQAILYILKSAAYLSAKIKPCMRIHLGVCSDHGLLRWVSRVVFGVITELYSFKNRSINIYTKGISCNGRILIMRISSTNESINEWSDLCD